MKAFARRTWTCSTLGSAVQWRADGALVQVTNPEAGRWVVDIFEDGAWIGGEEEGSRDGAVRTARSWVRALTVPA